MDYLGFTIVGHKDFFYISETFERWTSICLNGFHIHEYKTQRYSGVPQYVDDDG